MVGTVKALVTFHFSTSDQTADTSSLSPAGRIVLAPWAT